MHPTQVWGVLTGFMSDVSFHVIKSLGDTCPMMINAWWGMALSPRHVVRMV